MGLRETLEGATPAPWRLEYDSYDKYYDMPSPEDSTWVWRIEGICDFANEEGSEADARLIALAPELAALVLDMGAFIEKQFGVGGWLKDESQALLARLDRLGKEPA